MPIVPLQQISYEDAANQQKVVDTLNENFRLIDWLLNQKTNVPSSDSTLPANPAYNTDPSGNTYISQQFGGVTLQEADAAVVNINVPSMVNTEPVSDANGLNPKFMKMYPNKCWNSSFEVFNSATATPYYWETDGQVTPNANFSGTYSLMLTTGQAVEQAEIDGIGMANPVWWAWCNNTRISFRIKGYTAAVSVFLNGESLPITVDVLNKNGGTTKATTPVDSNGEYLLMVYGGYDWPEGLRTLTVKTNGISGKLQLRIACPQGPVFIDDVIIEPDYSGKWPSFYTDGPESDPGGSSSSSGGTQGRVVLSPNDVENVAISFLPETATLSATSSDESVATVGNPYIESEVNYIPITGINAGEAIITVTATADGYSDDFDTVSVKVVGENQCKVIAYPSSSSSANAPPSTDDGYLEIGTSNWSPSGAIFTLENTYTEMPIPVAGLVSHDATYSELTTTFVCTPLFDGSNIYYGVTVTPMGNVPDTIEGGLITLQAYCTGKV